MRDEGAPQILGKNRDGYYYVTIHGANYGSVVTGARGAARTRDFVHWQTSAPDLPTTAILSANDCNKWHVKWQAGGCICTGAAQILRAKAIGAFGSFGGEDRGASGETEWVSAFARRRSRGFQLE